MATIAKIQRANGFVYKAIVRKDGPILKAKTSPAKPMLGRGRVALRPTTSASKRDTPKAHG